MSCRRLAFALLVWVAPWSSRTDAIEVIFLGDFDPGFRIETPVVETAPGEPGTWCYYFRAPTTGSMGIRKWTSSMDAAMHHLILYATYDGNWVPLERQPEGTLVNGCTDELGDSHAGWIHAAHSQVEHLTMPADDGSGLPLGMEILPGQPLMLQMYVPSHAELPVSAAAWLHAEALGDGAPYTRTATYVASNPFLAIPPGASTHTVARTCAAPFAAKFWRLSTRTHRFAIESRIEDMAAPLVVSMDWERPSVANFEAPAFYQFSPTGLTYECTYSNPTGAVITFGEDEETSEVCKAIGYFFPAPRPGLCFGDDGPL